MESWRAKILTKFTKYLPVVYLIVNIIELYLIETGIILGTTTFSPIPWMFIITLLMLSICLKFCRGHRIIIYTIGVLEILKLLGIGLEAIIQTFGLTIIIVISLIINYLWKL